MLGKSWRGGPCIYWTSSPCRRSTDSATTAVSSARQHPECPETSQRCSRNVSFYNVSRLAAAGTVPDAVVEMQLQRGAAVEVVMGGQPSHAVKAVAGAGGLDGGEVPRRSLWDRRQVIVMGGAESNHGAMMRPGTHSTSHRTTHSSAHRRATGTVSSVRQLTATLTATLTGPGHSPVSRAARSERRGS